MPALVATEEEVLPSALVFSVSPICRLEEVANFLISLNRHGILFSDPCSHASAVNGEPPVEPDPQEASVHKGRSLALPLLMMSPQTYVLLNLIRKTKNDIR